MRSARRLYRIHVALAAVAATLVVGSLALLVAGFDFGVPSPASVAAACDRWLSAAGLGAVVALAVAALAAVGVTLGVRSAWRQVTASRRYIDALPLSEEAAEVDGITCRLVNTDTPLAFCAGYMTPTIYLSRGGIEALNPSELRAVVEHELHHARRRDPLRLLFARALAEALFFIPLLRRSSERYAALGELAADEAAVHRIGARAPLASALLRFNGPSAEPAPVVGIAPERVDHLMGDPEAQRWRLPFTAAVASAAAVFVLGGLLIALAQGAVVADLSLPLVLAASCTVAMVGGPIAVAVGALVLSHRALQGRRA